MLRIPNWIKRILPASILLNLRKIRTVRIMRGGTEHYEPEMKIIQSFVREGDFVVDIGASRGWYTRFLSDLVGKHGRVLAVEPIPRTYEILAYVVKRLGLPNVTTIQCAVTDVDGFVEMEIPRDSSGEPNNYLAKVVATPSGAENPVFRVPAMRLDTLVAEKTPRVTFIKCDVEGHETQVLRAATVICMHHRPGWLIEVWGDPDAAGSAASRTFGLLKEYGYSAYILSDGRLIARAMGDRGLNGNYFFFRSEHAERLPLPMAQE